MQVPQRLAGVGGLFHDVAMRLERDGHHLPDVIVVVDDEDARTFGLPMDLGQLSPYP